MHMHAWPVVRRNVEDHAARISRGPKPPIARSDSIIHCRWIFSAGLATENQKQVFSICAFFALGPGLDRDNNDTN